MTKRFYSERNYKDWMYIKDEYASIHQIRNHSAYRLYRKIGELDDSDRIKIYTRFLDLYKKMPPLDEGCGGKIPNHKTIIAKILDFCKRAIQKFKK